MLFKFGIGRSFNNKMGILLINNMYDNGNIAGMVKGDSPTKKFARLSL
jgi:hypothetical protein